MLYIIFIMLYYNVLLLLYIDLFTLTGILSLCIHIYIYVKVNY